MKPVLDIRIVAGRSDFRHFVNYPYDRHADDPHWVPPLRMSERERLTPSKNPFFEHATVELVLAVRDGRIAGRIAAIDDQLHNQTHDDNMAAFGFFEADDAETSRALLDYVEAWARKRGRSIVRGPLNPSLNESAGLLIDGFDTDPMLLMPHNPPLYAQYIEGAGYHKIKDLYAWLYDIRRPILPVLAKLAERVRERHRVVGSPGTELEFAL